MRRKICIVTGSRAEFGLLRLLMHGIRRSDSLDLQVVATGMHLATQFGSTYKEIEADGFVIDHKVEMLLSGDTPTAITKSMGVGMLGFADVFADLRPDILVVLGDRFEVFAAAAAAAVARIPIAHLHGGETTEGAIDEAFRHSITKMAHLHFVAAEDYRNRVIQLGEDPKRVYNVGGLGIDNIKEMQLLTRNELETELNFSLGKKNLLVTFHPTTLETNSASSQIVELLAALERLIDTHLIFTAPNADTEGHAILEQIEKFVAKRANACLFKSLGSLRYLSCLKYVDGVIGNSSSGLIEAPSFKIGTVNIGDRQRGRLKASSVIDCAPDRAAIAAAIDSLYFPQFQAQLASTDNPYGDGGAGQKVLNVLRDIPIDSILKKKFYDLRFSMVDLS